MNIKLVWINRNVKAVTTRVYRLAAPTDPLVTPIATLTNNEASYVDTTVTTGQTYYYALSVSDGTTTLNTTAIKVIATYNTGPGPSYPIWGNLNYGYYGTVSYQEMFTRSEFLSAVGLTETAYPAAAALPVWDKWARNGKTYFVPRTTMGAFFPSDVYNVGAYFGVSGPGFFIPTNGVSTPQNKTITKNGYVFTPMCPTAVGEALFPDTVPSGTDPLIARANSMASDFFYPTWLEVISPVQKIYRLVGAATTPSAMGTLGMSQNRIGANIISPNGSVGNFTGTPNIQEALTNQVSTTLLSYRPVLRLESNTVNFG